MQKLIIITGMTAVGKSKVALSLAKSFNTDIIMSDSI